MHFCLLCIKLVSKLAILQCKQIMHFCLCGLYASVAYLMKIELSFFFNRCSLYNNAAYLPEIIVIAYYHFQCNRTSIHINLARNKTFP